MNALAEGRLITLEGIEGAGKSSHMQFIAEKLQQAGKEVLLTREPGGTDLGEGIRALLLKKNEQAMFEQTELLLMFAARAQHVQQVILPAMAAGKIVICDRFTDSSYAYQGGGRGISIEKIRQLEAWLFSGDLSDFKPDLTLLLDLSVETGLSRARARGEADRFEIETVNFFQNARDTFLNIAGDEPGRVKIIDAEQQLEAVQSSILEVLVEQGLC
ncbi:MAG: dTMP kinase [Gammaproteobacteria bacterium]|nr:MAG: dTMP kinase [Gammaproteobacteria bacterium]